MILFFYGVDSYRMGQTVAQVKDKFLTANPDSADLIELNGRDVDPAKLKSQLLAMPLFSKSRLVVLKNFLSEAKAPCHEALLDIIGKIPTTTIIVITDSFPDKRLKIYKKLIKHAKCQEFKPLARNQLIDWLKNFVKESTLDAKSAIFLADNLSGNLWLASNILTKLEVAILHKPQADRLITLAMVQEQLSKLEQSNVFNLIDAFVSSSATAKKQALTYAKKLLEDGENAFYLISMLASGVKNLILIKDAQKNGHQSSAQIASYTKLNPFVISKNLNVASTHTLKNLIDLYEKIIIADALTKYGIIKPELAIEIILVDGLQHKFTSKFTQFV